MCLERETIQNANPSTRDEEGKKRRFKEKEAKSLRVVHRQSLP
jgi:hypothetical protein